MHALRASTWKQCAPRAYKGLGTRLECNGAAFLTSFQECPHQKSFLQGFFQNSASKMAKCIIVDSVYYLILLLVNF